MTEQNSPPVESVSAIEDTQTQPGEHAATAPDAGIADGTTASPTDTGELATSQTIEVLDDEEPACGGDEAGGIPVVGIGASAGGLQALEKLFTHMPADAGIAFVLVQHLYSTHKSILSELIQRYTRMKVAQIADGAKIEPNHIYIIPPNRDLAVLNGRLSLIERVDGHSPPLPIDFFFRSLAQDQQERSVCIVLSGTGADGTLGLTAVKEEGGMAMVQDPATAQYDGMPRSAIDTGLADFVLPPEKMPEQLVSYVEHACVGWYKKSASHGLDLTQHLDKIFVLLRNATGHDFSLYKPNTILRRIERRMSMHQIDRVVHYLRYMQEHPQEVQTLFKELLIGVSSFFRDPAAFAVLEQQVIPALFQQRQDHRNVRVWVPACATGEEAYSIAILMREFMDKTKQEFKVQIFATDIDSTAVETARIGRYPESIVGDVSAARIRRFFTKEETSYQADKTIRDLLVFAPQSLIKDPPFSNLDLISCRNLLIYMGTVLQKKVVPLFHYALNPNGYLFLGTSESIGQAPDLFSVIDRKAKVFQRKGKAYKEPVHLSLPIVSVQTADADRRERKTAPGAASLQELTETNLLKDYAPVCVLVDPKGKILYVHGRTGTYLEPATGEPNWNILTMAREGLRYDLTSALRQALSEKQLVRYDGVQVRIDGRVEVVNLAVKPLSQGPDEQETLMVVFEEAMPLDTDGGAQRIPPSAEGMSHVAELERELRSTREYLQTTIEEQETSNEELKAANEELQSSNEELQSTNEELETSKEEMQSVNEELITVNSEHELKLDELSKAHSDMQNLLASTEIGTIFLDLDLQIQRFTPTAAKVINLIAGDLGRPLDHMTSKLTYDRLVEDTRKVVDTLETQEREVQTKDGSWYLMRIRPYRTTENVIDGAVITFVDITEQKRLDRLAALVRDSNDAITLQDPEGHILAWNRGAEEMYGWRETDALKMNISQLVPDSKRDEAARFVASLTKGTLVRSFETQRLAKDGRILDVWLTVTALRDEHGKMAVIASTERDISERKANEKRLRIQHEQLRRVLDTLLIPIAYVDKHERHRFWNRAYEDWLGVPARMLEVQPLKEVLGEAGYGSVREHVQEALAGKQEVSFEESLGGKGATRRRMRIRYVPDKADSGEIHGFIVVCDEMSQR